MNIKYENDDNLHALLDSDDIQKYLGIGRSSTNKLLKEGELKNITIKICNRYKVRKEDFMEWLNSKSTKI